jgi:predicted lipoprotein with Yx(FWY)xxD motif
LVAEVAARRIGALADRLRETRSAAADGYGADFPQPVSRPADVVLRTACDDRGDFGQCPDHRHRDATTRGAGMTRRRTIGLLASAAVIPLAAGSVAGCGRSGSTTTATSSKATAAASATVSVASTSLGKILVDPKGRSLYLFKADVGTKSACTAACASAWPPLLTHGKPAVGGGASASLLGTAKRSDGTQQVTYNGHPLYLFVNDRSPGDVNGQGSTAFGAPWFVLSATGTQISSTPSSSGAGGSSRGSSGY